MTKNSNTHTIALREAILAGQPVTRLDSIAIFGVSDLMGLISDMRREGLLIKRRRIGFLESVQQEQKYILYEPPKALHVDELTITQYWFEPLWAFFFTTSKTDHLRQIEEMSALWNKSQGRFPC